MAELIRMLAFAHERGVARVFLHCLQDHPHKGGHNCYFDRYGVPRQSYALARLAARVVGGGYTCTRRDGLTQIRADASA